MTDNRDGLLVVDKVAGVSSFDVVRRVRRLAGTRKVGHTGTLDPDATGVLPIALGRCTKLSQYITVDKKGYDFTMEFGVATTTDDASGEVLRRAPRDHLTREALEGVLSRFVGEIEQVPPVYSAIKVDGKRAYARARAGETVELEARPVVVERLELLRWEPPVAELRVECGPGTYVRSLARDIGEALESAAHTTAIRRTRVGPFTLDRAVELEELDRDSFWDHVLSPMEMVVSLPTVELDSEQVRRVGHGQRLVVEGGWQREEAVAAHDGKGRLVAVMICSDRSDHEALLRPKRVMI